MLKEHLSQDHDAASRRFEKIEKHVAWIHCQVLLGNPTRILDLGCGPGLYASRLARLGHECVGIDFSPASIAYAREQAKREKLRCTYVHEDIRVADYGTGYGLVMLIFGEFNVFSPTDARAILEKAHHALAENGLLLLEPHTYLAVRKIGERSSSWYSASGGLFSDRPHICLWESFWDAENEATTERHFIIDALTADVARHAASTRAYTNEQYRSLLAECGFGEVEFHPSLVGDVDESQSDLTVVVSRKRNAG
jgi:SAM-dependent methyltransferase